jgi:membrane-associated phospholipid phosphatase
VQTWRPTLTAGEFWHNIPEYILVMVCTLVIIDPLISPAKPQNTTKNTTLAFLVRLILTSGTAALLAEMGKHYQVWPGHPGFPSGHTALTVAMCWNLYLRHKENNHRWAYLLGGIALAQAARLYLGHAHDLIEIGVGGILGTIFPLLWERLRRQK